jgi:CHAT domain-containing protein
LLEFFFRVDGGVVFVRSPRGLSVTELAVRPRDINRLLNQWNLNLAAAARAVATNGPLIGLGQNARGILAALYRALIAPVEAQLIGCERMIAIPYGPTHAVPFHALFDGDRHLLESYEVSVCPSSDLLRLCSEYPHDKSRRALVVGYTDAGRLPAVLEEARAISSLLSGECYTEAEATRSAVIAAAPHHTIVHLAAHGEARMDNPTFAHLKLADGQLGVVDVFNLELRGALVTLSACESGRSVVTGGDELIGLNRGFLYAGTSTLVQSLWRVEDGTTAELMQRFYRALTAGQAKGAALRDAQRAMLASKGVHPFFWAPFQLIGDSGPL